LSAPLASVASHHAAAPSPDAHAQASQLLPLPPPAPAAEAAVQAPPQPASPARLPQPPGHGATLTSTLHVTVDLDLDLDLDLEERVHLDASPTAAGDESFVTGALRQLAGPGSARSAGPLKVAVSLSPPRFPAGSSRARLPAPAPAAAAAAVGGAPRRPMSRRHTSRAGPVHASEQLAHMHA